jgi:hypothetical protein
VLYTENPNLPRPINTFSLTSRGYKVTRLIIQIVLISWFKSELGVQCFILWGTTQIILVLQLLCTFIDSHSKYTT